MIKLYKNDVHRIIKEVVNLDPNRFTLIDSDENGFPVSQVTITDSKMSFWFRNRKTSWEKFDYKLTRFSPAFSVSEWTPNSAQTYSYEQISAIFTQWLRTDAKPFLDEIDTLDKWNSFQFETDIFQLIQGPFADNSNFSIEESNTITNSIDNLKQLIIDKFNPIEEKLNFINERLDYLSNATTRLGKFDWKSTFVSTMISIVINMMFDKETGKQFFDLIRHAFQSVKSIIAG